MSEHPVPAFASPVDYEKYGYYSARSKDRRGERPLYQFRDRIRRDGSTPYAPEPGRYHLYLALGCPWAQSTAIAVRLLGLDGVITYSLVDDVRDGRGWAFRELRGVDPINNFQFLKQAYLATDLRFEGHVNVPTTWDRKSSRVVNNANDDIFMDLVTQFSELATRSLDLYPLNLQEQIDELDADLLATFSAGTPQVNLPEAREHNDLAVPFVYRMLDALEVRLNDRRYLWGPEITESDIRLYVTLARFDIVTNPIYKTNLRRLVDYPNLWGYARDLYSLDAFRELTDFDAFRLTYYHASPLLHRSGTTPSGPHVDWNAPHDRARLSNNGAERWSRLSIPIRGEWLGAAQTKTLENA
jgi:glutathionyl-hydroquinone reductase